MILFFKYKFLNNLKLKNNLIKLNLILNIFNEKQFIFFVYFYLFLFQHISKSFVIYAINLNLNFFRKFLINFFNKFTFNFFYFFKNIKFYNSSIRKLKYFFNIFPIKKKLLNFKENYNSLIKKENQLKFLSKKNQNKNIKQIIYKKETKLDLKEFYLNKILKVNMNFQLCVFFNRKRKNNQLFFFNNLSIFMLRFFKFKLIFMLFFKLNNLYLNKVKYLNFMNITRFKKSQIINKLYISKINKYKNKMIFFYLKYKKKIKVLNISQTNSSIYLPLNKKFRNDFYFLLKINNKLIKSKQLYLLSTGRYLIYRFSNYLNLPLIFKYTEYQYLKKNYFKSFMKSNKKLNKFNKRLCTKLISRSRYKISNNLRSCNYFIKKPLQKLIVSGKKKLGYNIFNNLFLSMHKLYKRSMYDHILVINKIFKSVFIRATIKNQERNRSKMGVRQSCGLLIGFEELRSRTNIFFYDFVQSLIRKKNKKFRIRKVKDLIFSDFFNCTIKKRSKRRRKNTHLLRTFYEIYDLMFKEFTLRNKYIFKKDRVKPIFEKPSRKKFKYRFKFKKNIYKTIILIKFKYVVNYFKKRLGIKVNKKNINININENIKEKKYKKLKIKSRYTLLLKKLKYRKNFFFKQRKNENTEIKSLFNFIFINKNKFKNINLFLTLVKNSLYFLKNRNNLRLQYKKKIKNKLEFFFINYDQFNLILSYKYFLTKIKNDNFIKIFKNKKFMNFKKLKKKSIKNKIFKILKYNMKKNILEFKYYFKYFKNNYIPYNQRIRNKEWKFYFFIRPKFYYKGFFIKKISKKPSVKSRMKFLFKKFKKIKKLFIFKKRKNIKNIKNIKNKKYSVNIYKDISFFKFKYSNKVFLHFKYFLNKIKKLFKKRKKKILYKKFNWKIIKLTLNRILYKNILQFISFKWLLLKLVKKKENLTLIPKIINIIKNVKFIYSGYLLKNALPIVRSFRNNKFPSKCNLFINKYLVNSQIGALKFLTKYSNLRRNIIYSKFKIINNIFFKRFNLLKNKKIKNDKIYKIYKNIRYKTQRRKKWFDFIKKRSIVLLKSFKTIKLNKFKFTFKTYRQQTLELTTESKFFYKYIITKLGKIFNIKIFFKLYKNLTKYKLKELKLKKYFNSFFSMFFLIVCFVNIILLNLFKINLIQNYLNYIKKNNEYTKSSI